MTIPTSKTRYTLRMLEQMCPDRDTVEWADTSWGRARVWRDEHGTPHYFIGHGRMLIVKPEIP
jgi:hypothetical protein